MKVVILAGGFGTRISEESAIKPKPMIEIGEKPILWHVMKIYSSYGFNEFVICLGYKGFMIKEYFAHYFLHQSDVTFDFTSNNEPVIHNQYADPWKVTLVDTGLDTMTGGRIKRIEKYIGKEQFMLTYGDGVSDVNIPHVIDFHNKNGKIATLTAVQPGGRFGMIEMQSDYIVSGFKEKPQGDGAWINGGFFVLEPAVFDFIPEDDSIIFEKEPLETLANRGQLAAFKHKGFWQPMDSLRDKNKLEELWQTNKASWKIW
jgi:glucose-1-phosphate cytidylyltransferase